MSQSKYRLSISNIAWKAGQDFEVYEIMHTYGFTGLEIAPTRIFPEKPYDNLQAARKWADDLEKMQGFCIPSMQSVWYGRKENMFGNAEERNSLIDYTRKAIDFAEIIGCKNLVFGCPGNRSLPEGKDSGEGVPFFKEVGDYASKHHTVIGMEANPPIYHTNYINTTKQALALIKEVDSDGFKLNLDLGTMIYNEENICVLDGNEAYINHVHVSEPGLKLIERRKLHKELAAFLKLNSYAGFVSVEMGSRENTGDIADTCQYVREIFG